MNVYVYVTLVTLAGLIVAFLLGRAAAGVSVLVGAMSFLVASIVLGVALTFPVLTAVAHVCGLLGVAESDCVRTDDTTVWYLAIPLVLCPAYMVCMFVGRSAGRRADA